VHLLKLVDSNIRVKKTDDKTALPISSSLKYETRNLRCCCHSRCCWLYSIGQRSASFTCRRR